MIFPSVPHHFSSSQLTRRQTHIHLIYTNHFIPFLSSCVFFVLRGFPPTLNSQLEFFPPCELHGKHPYTLSFWWLAGGATNFAVEHHITHLSPAAAVGCKRCGGARYMLHTTLEEQRSRILPPRFTHIPMLEKSLALVVDLSIFQDSCIPGKSL